MKTSCRRRVYTSASLYCSLCFMLTGQAVRAQPGPVDLAEVRVTASPSRSATFDLVQPASVLQGSALLLQRANTLGETLQHTPGVASSYFGPNASRPVSRGLDGDRVRVLKNGIGLSDAAALSPDHAVANDPITVERIEVLRGPAALLYGGNAVGGVVNVIDNAIASTPIHGVEGVLDLRLTGGGDRERAGAVKLDAGNGRLAIHLDAYTRRTQDLKIKGFQRTEFDRTNGTAPPYCRGDEPVGSVCNSSARVEGGTAGGSITWGDGFAGVSIGSVRQGYGTIAEPDVRIKLKSDTLNLAGEVRALGPRIDALKWKFVHTDYRHTEFDLGVPATTFLNKGFEGRLEAQHGQIGPLTGTVGWQGSTARVSALGAEAFIPRSSTHSNAVFVFEEAQWGALKLSGGARAERNRVTSSGGGPLEAEPSSANLGNPRFGNGTSRSFGAASGSLGAHLGLGQGFALAGNLAYTERAPTYAELFANGPHAATAAYEIGDPALGKEKSRALDLALRWKEGAHSFGITVFQNRFRNFVSLQRTVGVVRNSEGVINPADTDGDGLDDATLTDAISTANEMRFVAVPARFRGAELEGRFRLLDSGGRLDLGLRADLTRAVNLANGAPLPRIAPARLALNLDYAQAAWSAGIEMLHAVRQVRVPAGESTTPGYTVWNAALTYRFTLGSDAMPLRSMVYLKANNLFNREVRYATSIIREVAPGAGRSLQAGLRVEM